MAQTVSWKFWGLNFFFLKEPLGLYVTVTFYEPTAGHSTAQHNTTQHKTPFKVLKKPSAWPHPCSGVQCSCISANCYFYRHTCSTAALAKRAVTAKDSSITAVLFPKCMAFTQDWHDGRTQLPALWGRGRSSSGSRWQTLVHWADTPDLLPTRRCGRCYSKITLKRLNN